MVVCSQTRVELPFTFASCIHHSSAIVKPFIIPTILQILTHSLLHQWMMQVTQHIYDTIDTTILGDVPWQSFSVEFNGDVSELDHEGAPWKLKSYDVWFRDPRLILHNQLGNRDFAGKIDLCAKRVYDNKNKCRYQNFMSGNWPWRQSVCTCSF